MPAPSQARRRSARYAARPSVVMADQWVIHDDKTKLCVRTRSTIRLFATRAQAEAVAEQMNTAVAVCVTCRHKALVADCDHKVCARCRHD